MKTRLATEMILPHNDDSQPLPAAEPVLMARLRARIARRPGRWRRRMHTRRERREDTIPPIPAAA
jgi:hypothetical protein